MDFDIITLKWIDPIGDYVVVLEYANKGNLRNYLKSEFTSLKWKDKIRMGLDIACGLRYIHSKDIIHGDLVNHYYIVFFVIVSF